MYVEFYYSFVPQFKRADQQIIIIEVNLLTFDKLIILNAVKDLV